MLHIADCITVCILPYTLYITSVFTIALHITLHIALYSACCIVSVVLFSLFAVDSSGEDEETNADDAKQTM